MIFCAAPCKSSRPNHREAVVTCRNQRLRYALVPLRAVIAQPARGQSSPLACCRQMVFRRKLWRKEPACEPSLPYADKAGLSCGLGDAAPRLGRRASMQVLMRPRMVVPGPKFDQLGTQLVLAGDSDPVQLVLEGAEETLDAPVLPGAVQLGGLQADAEQGQRGFHQAAVEACLVVHANRSRQAKVATRHDQLVQDGQAACRRGRPCRSGPSPTHDVSA